MNVLITGGGGFIGSHTADRLLERGDRVTIVDNFATGRRDNLAPRANLEIVGRDLVAGLQHVHAFQRSHVYQHAARE